MRRATELDRTREDERGVLGISNAIDLAAESPNGGCVVLTNNTALQCWRSQTAPYYVPLVQAKLVVSDLFGGVCAIEAGNQLSCWKTNDGQPQRVLPSPVPEHPPSA